MPTYMTRPQHGKIVYLGTLVIANGAQKSSIMSMDVYQGFPRLTIVGPAALTNTVALEGLREETLDVDTDANWVDVQSGDTGADIDVAADKAISFRTPGVPAIRVYNQTGAEGAERTFYVYGIRH